jgi:hypothetical protein
MVAVKRCVGHFIDPIADPGLLFGIQDFKFDMHELGWGCGQEICILGILGMLIVSVSYGKQVQSWRLVNVSCVIEINAI